MEDDKQGKVARVLLIIAIIAAIIYYAIIYHFKPIDYISNTFDEVISAIEENNDKVISAIEENNDNLSIDEFVDSSMLRNSVTQLCVGPAGFMYNIEDLSALDNIPEQCNSIGFIYNDSQEILITFYDTSTLPYTDIETKTLKIDNDYYAPIFNKVQDCYNNFVNIESQYKLQYISEFIIKCTGDESNIEFGAKSSKSMLDGIIKIEDQITDMVEEE